MPAKSNLFSIKELIPLVKGKCLSPVKDIETFNEVTIDSRKLKKEQAFIALKGKNHDGHTFIPQAIEKGARICLIHQWNSHWEPLKKKSLFILVPDTLVALQSMAHFHRKQMGAQIIAITGSNGKTSTKEFTFQILSSLHSTHRNEGNFNNHIGLPLTLLKLKKEHIFGISEMGTSSPGEIASLVQIAEPDISLCTNVSEAHIEFFPSKEAIAKEKAQIYQPGKENPFNKVQVFNLDNPYTLAMYEKCKNLLPHIPRWVFSTDKSKKTRYLFLLGKNGPIGSFSVRIHRQCREKKSFCAYFWSPQSVQFNGRNGSFHGGRPNPFTNMGGPPSMFPSSWAQWKCFPCLQELSLFLTVTTQTQLALWP